MKVFLDHKYLVGISYPGDAFISATFFNFDVAIFYAANLQALTNDEWPRDGGENVSVWTVIDVS